MIKTLAIFKKIFFCWKNPLSCFRPETPALYPRSFPENMTSTTILGTGTSASNIQDGENVEGHTWFYSPLIGLERHLVNTSLKFPLSIVNLSY